MAEWELAETLSSDQVRDIYLAFVRDVIEPGGLECEERSSGRRSSFVVRSEASQATDLDREAVDAWAATRPEIVSATIGPLLDFASAA